ncbi:LysR substrate-binding domain-containing protein [Nannocystis sp. ILAH1]|uniref:LysR substrate-binding domain-containing protein n=1 Tax=unclassified Nannocystis TaxID=2627009 RepID=UPI00226FB43E|nr:MULTISPECIES: LysR substrate-binding domain-containing protein [unclassified Nannocystis]MCY0985726.1 LysR substrate-binding domain-containing protein [Nannocystis sp. ILAH1]MCY1068409.1 LysR substrate-binding domain-containing protein [Nannocystis sp. RBIL2]
MLDLNDVHFFVQVVDRGGFSAAARALLVPTSTLSHRIQQLEAALGVTLLARTSRKVTATDAGREFYRHAVQMLEKATEAEMAMKQRLTEPAGPVRYTAAQAIAQVALPGMVNAFLHKYPKVNLIQHVTDEQVDIIAEGFDLAIRGHSGPLPDSSLIQKPLARVPWYLYASPAFLAQHGTPASPGALAPYASLFMMRESVAPCWHLRHEFSEDEFVLPLTPRVHAGCMVSLKSNAKAGLGIVALPGYVCRDEVQRGELVRVLPDWHADESTISALMPGRHGMSAGLRAFIDHLADGFPAAVAVD